MDDLSKQVSVLLDGVDGGVTCWCPMPLGPGGPAHALRAMIDSLKLSLEMLATEPERG